MNTLTAVKQTDQGAGIEQELTYAAPTAPSGGTGAARSHISPAEFIAGRALKLDERQRYGAADGSERDLADRFRNRRRG